MNDSATATFEAERGRLRALAYRMLGTPDDADDILQDAWLRWNGTDQASIENPAAWLTTVTTRLALDKLKSAQRQRETYVGPWLPEPVSLGPGVAASDDPVDSILLAESVSFGFMTVMERLAPVERAVFLLHDVFGVPFDEIATTVEMSPAAARQTAKRARERVRAERPRFAPNPADVERLADQFLHALLAGDVDGVTSLLAESVVHLSDGGAQRHAARRPVTGRDRVARLLVNLTSRLIDSIEVHPVHANGQFGHYVLVDGQPLLVIVMNWSNELVDGIFAVLNPDKLVRFHAEWSASRDA